jgi:hypothetical protein
MEDEMFNQSSLKSCGIDLMFCALITTALSVPISARSAVDKTSTIEASGEGSLYDVKANAAGTLRVCTKPGRSGDRWRATIAQATTAGGVSAVGTGSTAAFTGCVTRQVVSGVQYLVLVTWERPLPGVFPASITVHFTGPTDTTNPPVTSINGAPLSSVVARSTSFTEIAQGCPVDGSTITCGALVNCSFDSTSDLDTFRFTVPANSVMSTKICGPYPSSVSVFGPTGNVIGAGAIGGGVFSLSVPGSYIVQTSNVWGATGAYSLSLEGVSQTYQCALPIAFNQSRSGSFDSCADTDTFRFVCQVNQVININVAGPYPTSVTLFDPSGAIVIGGAIGGGTYTCATSGVHVIEVSNVWGATGGYSLTLQKIAGP